MNYLDEQTVPAEWYKKNLIEFNVVITRYLECLKPLRGPGNNLINDEIKDWNSISQKIHELTKQLTDDNESAKLYMYGKNYGKLYDILKKYYSAKNQLLIERKSQILEDAAHEGATAELERVSAILALKFWEQLKSNKCLVDSFYPKDEPKDDEAKTAMKITIGNIYGQFAVNNYGPMIQNNNSEVIDALKAITEAFVESNLSDKDKQDALLDIESVQTQLKKDKPNRRMLETGMGALQVAANIAQILPIAKPHFDKIMNFIGTLQIPQL